MQNLKKIVSVKRMLRIMIKNVENDGVVVVTAIIASKIDCSLYKSRIAMLNGVFFGVLILDPGSFPLDFVPFLLGPIPFAIASI